MAKRPMWFQLFMDGLLPASAAVMERDFRSARSTRFPLLALALPTVLSLSLGLAPAARAGTRGLGMDSRAEGKQRADDKTFGGEHAHAQELAPGRDVEVHPGALNELRPGRGSDRLGDRQPERPRAARDEGHAVELPDATRLATHLGGAEIVRVLSPRSDGSRLVQLRSPDGRARTAHFEPRSDRTNRQLAQSLLADAMGLGDVVAEVVAVKLSTGEEGTLAEVPPGYAELGKQNPRTFKLKAAGADAIEVVRRVTDDVGLDSAHILVRTKGTSGNPVGLVTGEAFGLEGARLPSLAKYRIAKGFGKEVAPRIQSIQPLKVAYAAREAGLSEAQATRVLAHIQDLQRQTAPRGDRLSPREAADARAERIDLVYGHGPAFDSEAVEPQAPQGTQGWAEAGGRPRLQLPDDTSVVQRFARLFQEAGRTIQANGGVRGSLAKVGQAVGEKGPALLRQAGSRFKNPGKANLAPGASEAPQPAPPRATTPPIDDPDDVINPV